MQGKNFLKVTGILMIIFGAIAILGDLFAGIICTACAAAVTDGSAGVIAVAIVGSIIGCAGGILELIAGLIGVKNCDNAGAAGKCLVWGIIVFVIELVSVIMTIASGTDNSAVSIVITIISGLAIPVLYIIGAVLNKKNA